MSRADAARNGIHGDDEAAVDPDPDSDSDPNADDPAGGPPGGGDAAGDRLARLRAENRRLRDAYDAARRDRTRRTAAGFLVVALVAAVGAALFPPVRDVLVVLAGTGAFAGLLTYALTPERFVPADVGERVTRDLAADRAALVADLGCSDRRVYVPTPGDLGPARLFVPQHADADVPDAAALSDPLVVPDGDDRERGLAFTPAGASLFREVRASLAGGLATEPSRLADQLTEALVAGLEVADAVDHEVDAASGRLSVAIDGGVFGSTPGFDDPLASLLAVGLAVGLDAPVETTVRAGEGSYTVTCSWDPAAVADGSARRDAGTDDPADRTTAATGDADADDGAGDADVNAAGAEAIDADADANGR